MGVELLAIGLLAQTVITVEVRNFRTQRTIESAQVWMDNGDTIERRPTRSNGQARFRGECTDDIKFWARVPDEPHFLDPSPTMPCQLPRVTLRIRPR